MITIVNCNKQVSDMLGVQEYDCHLEYRLIAYLIEIETNDGYLVQNTLTREMVLFTKTEYDLFKNMNIEETKKRNLVLHWFYIPTTMCEKSISYVIFQKHLQKQKKIGFDKKNMYTIFTTTRCNARCPYCYERGIEHHVMSREIALDVAKYIDSSRVQGAKIRLKWFGGEPLLNGKAISTICDYLNNVGVEFASNITSNGYLFDKYTDEEIINDWHIENAQITLDGTKEVYENTKKYVNDDKSAFEKVIQNIKRLLNLGIRVTIRMNISSNNGSNLLELLNYLKQKFNGRKNLKIYSYILFDESDPQKKAMNKNERKRACEFYEKIEKEIALSGFGVYGFKFPSVHTSHCMADNGTSICITPTGNITLCEHHTDDEIIGNIYNGISNYSTMNSWSERVPESESCKTCPFYPQCITLKKCPSFINGCDDFIRLRKKISAGFSMENAYKNYLLRKEHEKSDQ